MKLGVALLVAAAGAVLAWLAMALFGGWSATFFVSLLAGVYLARRRPALLAGGLIGLGAWGLPLLVASLGQPVARTAVVVAGVLGMPGAGGAAAVAFTVATGLLLGLAGAWLGSASRRVAA